MTSTADATTEHYWTCENDPECGLVIEGRSIVTCESCWAEASKD